MTLNPTPNSDVIFELMESELLVNRFIHRGRNCIPQLE